MRLRICMLFVLLGFGTIARADYMPFNGASIAPNVAEIHVGEEGVRVQLEVFLDDIAVFEALIPDDWATQTPANRASLEDRMTDFANNGISLQRDDGSVLPVRAQLVEPRMRTDRASAWAGRKNPITGRFFPSAPEDTRVVYAELFYDFEGIRPTAITISPPSDAEGKPLVSIGMVVFDREVPTTKFSFMSDVARLEIDWKDPWYSSFNSPNLKRHHQSALTTFLYIEPREVRHETLIRVNDLGDWTELDLKGVPMMDKAAQERIKASARTFLAQRNPVTIDGKPVVPASSRASLLKITDSGLLLVEDEASLDPLSTFVGVILSFPVPTLPKNATVTWDMFTPRIDDVPATITDPAGPFLSGATPKSPVIDWANFLRTFQDPKVEPVATPTSGTVNIPWISLAFIVVAAVAVVIGLSRDRRLRIIFLSVSIVCLGLAIVARQIAVSEVSNPFQRSPDPETAAEIFSALLSNINTANLQTAPMQRISDLQSTVSETEMPEVIAELDRALSIQIAGGGLAKVNAIEGVVLSEIAPLPERSGFRALAEWTVHAGAAHWGHDHRRNLSYRALVEILRESGVWKISGITVVDTRDAD
ncbi:hypothetical protein AB9F29_20580 [Falsihalocynthiibacter sp. S25ZX9]|uniref:hypothetical protein n=1 Tax=Falsihalocynthiibacter sp. S25ZX9 TaxID=3240870 RepID=UPI003510759B